MKIMGLDVATQTGWALYDLDRPPSSIVCGSFKCEGQGAFAKVSSMRQKLPGLLRKHAPDFVAIERPLDRIIQHKKIKKDMLGQEEVVSTVNPATVMQLNRLMASAQTVVEGFNIPCCEVAPRTWQSLIPKSITAKDSKHRVRYFCESMNIEGGNADSRDAAVIALWAAGHCQELRMMQRAS